MTVSQSQIVMRTSKSDGDTKSVTVVTTETTSTTNITGFRTIVRGSSFRSTSGRAVHTIDRSIT
ncbi:MAG: hypothetical protein QOE25_115 [Actinomycetota bacterium]|nr:hypothetical protein [Actinomycetota bacterium]